MSSFYAHDYLLCLSLFVSIYTLHYFCVTHKCRGILVIVFLVTPLLLCLHKLHGLQISVGIFALVPCRKNWNKKRNERELIYHCGRPLSLSLLPKNYKSFDYNQSLTTSVGYYNNSPDKIINSIWRSTMISKDYSSSLWCWIDMVLWWTLVSTYFRCFAVHSYK